MVISPGIGDNRPKATLYYGQDVRKILQSLEEASIHTVCTSPPFWGLRDYGGGDTQIGLEDTPEAFVESLVEVFREIKRVLRPDGTVWLNLGDSYAGGGRAGKNPEYHANHKMFGKTTDPKDAGKFGVPKPVPQGLKAKDLVGIPWKVAFALQADGWYLRSAAPWIKGNCMPESCTDRPTTATEYIFLLAHPDSGGKYFYDIDAVRIDHNPKWVQARKTHDASRPDQMRSDRRGDMALRYDGKVVGNPAGRNRRNTDSWNEMLEVSAQALTTAQTTYGPVHNSEGDLLAFKVNPKPYSGAHFATWPPELIRPMILAGTSEHGCCSGCGAPWKRERISLEVAGKPEVSTSGYPDRQDGGVRTAAPKGSGGGNFLATTTQAGKWEPSCSCGKEDRIRAVVLDPFSGAATINADYLDLAEARLQGERAPKEMSPEETAQSSIFDMFGGE